MTATIEPASISSFLCPDTPLSPNTPKPGVVKPAPLVWGASSSLATISESAVPAQNFPVLAKRYNSGLGLVLSEENNGFMEHQSPRTAQAPPLSRFASEDFMGIFSLPSAPANAAPVEQENTWNDNAPSPTNVEDLGPATLARGKSSDFMMSGEDMPAELVRFKSEEYNMGLARFKSEELPLGLCRFKSEDLPTPMGLYKQKSEDLIGLLLARGRSDSLSSLLTQETAPVHTTSTSASAPLACIPEVSTPSTPPADCMHEVTCSQPAAHTAHMSACDEEDSEMEARPKTRNNGKATPKRKKDSDDEEESDEEYVPGRGACSGSGGNKGHCNKKAKKNSPSGKHAHNNRGAHVKGRPEMQETARKGQEHWAREVQAMRDRWSDERCFEANSAFQGQLELMARRHIKNQHECLLRSLHIATARGLVHPHSFNQAEGKSFLGWTGFDVVSDKAQEFRSMIEEMFPQPLLENTLHNTFRRAGLVPSSWGEAWLGLAPFMYKKPVS